MKRRSFFYFLVASVFMLLLTGIGGCSWLSRDPLTLLGDKSQTNPAAAMFVPKQAPVMVSLLVNPDRIKKRRQTRLQVNQLKTSLLANTGLDYRRDIKPWLGDEITLAVTSIDIDRDAKNGRQTGYLMALSTVDSSKSREFLEQLFSKRAIAGKNLVYEQYKGVKLIWDNSQPEDNQKTPKALPDENEETLAGAVVDDRFVLFANYPKVLRDAINNVQAPALGLSSSSEYQQAITKLPTNSIGVTFLHLPTLGTWFGSEPKAQVYQNQIIFLQLNPQGLLAETILLATSSKQEISASAPDASPTFGALQYIPTKTGLAISGLNLSHLKNTDLNQLWTQVSAQLSSSTDALSRLSNQPLAVEARWGVNLQQDIFSWVQGEYALGLLPHLNQTFPDWVFVVEKSDATDAGISRLNAIASSQGLSISSLTLGKQKISAWTQLTDAPAIDNLDRTTLAFKAKIQGVHAAVGNYEIFTTSVGAMEEALKAPEIGSLDDNPKFQASIAPIPRPNKGYLYLDWTASREILERQLPQLKLLEVIGDTFFSHLRSIAVSSYGSESGLLKGGVSFTF